MKKSLKLSALILSAALTITAGAAIAATANAAPADTSAITEKVNTFDLSFITGNKWNVSRILDANGNQVNPYLMFGTSFRLAHSVVFNEDGTFAVYLGASKGNDPQGAFKYNELSAKIFLNYKDGFNAVTYVAYDQQGEVMLRVPVVIDGEIYSVECSL